MSVAAALRKAQLWLRNLPNAEARQRLNTLRRTWWERYQEALERGDFAEAGYARTQHDRLREGMARIEKMGPYPFAHPYYWGAFQAVDAAS
jgi:CHAT domain-containing protein